MQRPLLYIISLGLLACSQAEKEETADHVESQSNETTAQIIPRDTIFNATRYHDFKCNPDGSVVYFKAQGNDTTLHYIEVGSGQHGRISLGEHIGSWTPVVRGVVAMTSVGINFSLKHYINADTIISLPYGIGTPAKIIDQNKASIAILQTLQGSPGKQLLYYNVSAGMDMAGPYFSSNTTPYLNANLDPIAYEVSGVDGSRILLVEGAEGLDTLAIVPRTMDFFIGGFSKILCVSDDGDRVYYTSNAETDKTRAYVYDRTTHQSTEIAKSDLVDIIPFAFSTGPGGDLASVVGLFARTERTVLEPDHQAHFDFLEKELQGEVGFIQTADNGSKWLIREFLGGFARIYMYSLKSKELTLVTSDCPSLDNYDLASRYAYSVETSDGWNIPFHVYLPPGSDTNRDGIPDQPLPTIIYAHGGPWVGVVHWNSNFHGKNFQLLANRGYAVINAEFRGSTGLGKKFVEASRKVWGTDMVQDKVDIVDRCIDLGISDPDNVGFWGWSYGGYAGLAGAAFTDRYKCVLSMYGISDLVSFGHTDFSRSTLWEDYVGNVRDKRDAKMLADYSAMHHLDGIEEPMLLTTGSQDDRIPQIQYDTLAQALDDAGKEVVYFYYPEEGHDYEAPGSWISFWAIAEQFLAKHLGGRFQPKGEDLKKGDYVLVNGQHFVEELK